MIKQFWKHLHKRRRKQFFLLLILMVVASIMEVVSIGAIVPFLSVLTAPEQIYQHHLAQPLIKILEITEPSQLLLPLTIIFVVATLISATVRLLLLYSLPDCLMPQVLILILISTDALCIKIIQFIYHATVVRL